METIELYRDGDRTLYTSPGRGRDLVHPDDSIDCLTEAHIFSSAARATGFAEGVEAAARVAEEDVNVSCPTARIVIVEYLNREHEQREVPAFVHKK